MKTTYNPAKYTAVLLVAACVGCGDRYDSSTAESSPPSRPAAGPTPAVTPDSATPSPVSGNAQSMSEMAANSPHVEMNQFTDGMSGTLLAGTVSENRSVPWTKPDDIRLDDSFLSKENSFVEGNFMFADGSVRYVHIEEDMDAVKFRALFTINGGEPHSPQTLYPEGYKFTFPKYETPQDHIRHTKARMATSNALKEIVRAFHQYHNVNKHFPPATINGPDGKPWHSWRVLILPFLGHNDLYQQYDHSVPWDDPKNESILKQIPPVYRDPLSDNPDDTRTRYLVISGPRTAFPLDVEK